MLILLQTLDADGNLNNGIQITEQIRTEVSLAAADMNFAQPVADFRTAITGLVADLESAGAFSDTDPRARKVVAADDAREHFSRSTGERIVVATTGGELRGFESSNTTWQFLGVPYAKPPLGELRWRAPEPAEPWEGVRDAVAWSDQAAQNAARKVRSLGMPVRIGTYERAGKTHRIVLAGPFADAGAAQGAVASARRAGFAGAALRK